MTGLLITFVLFPLLGSSIARRSWGEAFLFGVGITGAALFVAGVARVPLVITFVGIGVWGVGRGVWGVIGNRSQLPRSLPTPHSPLPTTLMIIPLIILAFIAAITPLNDFDGRAFWVLKAKGIAHERSIDGPFFHGATLDPRNHYPILIPIDGAVIFALSHSLDDRQLRWLYVGLLAALALLVRERIGRLISQQAGAWCAAILVWIPQFSVATEGGALSAYNDIAIAAFAAGAFFELVDAVARKVEEDSNAREIRFGLWLTFLVLTKSEGLPFALVLLLVAAFVFRKRVLVPAAFAIVATLALVIWRSRIPAGDEEDIVRMLPTIPDKLNHIGAALSAFPRHMLDVSSWGIFWIAVVIAAVIAMRVDRRATIIAVAFIVAMLAVYIGVYIATEWVVADLIAVTANRLLMHLAAPALFLLALAAQWTRTKSM